MSASVGIHEQPLHTDGAHLATPPDYIAFEAVQPTPVTTRLWPCRDVSDMPIEAMEHGVFEVSSGPTSFYASAKFGCGFRFDPCCMTPRDALASEVVRYFARIRSKSFSYAWTSGEGLTLIVDNRNVLHARDACDETDLSRELHRVAFRKDR